MHHGLRLTALSLATLAACAAPKDDGKGVLDQAPPPEDPTAAGKADGADQHVAINLESAHPYANNADLAWNVDTSGLPSCAQRGRLRFAALQTEANWDYVVVTQPDGETQWFDGNQDGAYTEWFELGGPIEVRLLSDGSIVRHGFKIDAIQWEGQPEGCVLRPLAQCPEGSAAIVRPAGTCECPNAHTCVGLETVEIRHAVAMGRNNQSKQIVGTSVSATAPGPTDAPQTRSLGTIPLSAIDGLIDLAQASRILWDPGYDTAPEGVFFDELTLTVGPQSVRFRAAVDGHTPEVKAFIAAFEAALLCAGDGAQLACGENLTCEEGACVPEMTCMCPALYDPVCGVDGRTYSNACAAGCAEMGVAHDGECGQPGDMCGSIMGLTCIDENRCRYDASTFEAPFPDAAGTCVARDYCDAPTDCAHLPHIAVPGQWTCETNTCAFRAGSPWRAFDGGTFGTAHPYANSTSVWHKAWLPEGAAAMRLAVDGTFALENNYDFLEVWSWQGGAWRRIQRFTGNVAPTLDTEFAGRYHYLRFVSDSSVVKHGFDVRVEWR